MIPQDPRIGSSELASVLEESDPGSNVYRLICELYPLCRSLTGNGVRETLRALQTRVPLTIHEVPSGTKVFDWTIPKEWNIRDAYIANSRGERIIDFHQCNLHVLGYSVPIHKTLTLKELRNHLFSEPQYPDWIPYRTAYYQENWGFCLSHNQLLHLEDVEYEVFIDSSLDTGSLTFGEYYLPGAVPNEILISCHICHPSLCNDNLSGIAVATKLAQFMSRISRRHSFRFLFIPATIGAITWLYLNQDRLSLINHGLILACLGDPGRLTYKRSRRGNSDIDKAVSHVLRYSKHDHEIMDFSPFGYDERQFCSPGIDLPVGCLMRTPHGRFPQYHTSADNLEFVRPEYLQDSLETCRTVVSILENNRFYLNQNPNCEPQLGRRGLYRGYPAGGPDDLALLWVLNYSDGTHTLLDIADKANIPFATVCRAADKLLQVHLLKASP